MSESPLTLTLADLRAAVEKRGAAFRARVVLDPAGGPGDKVFPPTYATGDREPTKYAVEQRRVGDEVVTSVLLDSVASQANRMEEALLAAWRANEIDIPVVAVDFTGDGDLADLGEITALEAPHRLADAILRDGVLDGKPYRHSAPGRAFTDASPRNATAVYLQGPHALVFGMWDSTGPKGGVREQVPARPRVRDRRRRDRDRREGGEPARSARHPGFDSDLRREGRRQRLDARPGHGRYGEGQAGGVPAEGGRQEGQAVDHQPRQRHARHREEGRRRDAPRGRADHGPVASRAPAAAVPDRRRRCALHRRRAGSRRARRPHCPGCARVGGHRSRSRARVRPAESRPPRPPREAGRRTCRRRWRRHPLVADDRGSDRAPARCRRGGRTPPAALGAPARAPHPGPEARPRSSARPASSPNRARPRPRRADVRDPSGMPDRAIRLSGV
jgi:CRISPR-associated protein Csb1